MTKLLKTKKWTFSLTLLVAFAGATLFGGFYGNRLFGSPMQSDSQKRFREYSDMLDRQKGSFYGLGILVTKRNDKVTVITPMEGTPAARLGIRAGDVISEVEG